MHTVARLSSLVFASRRRRENPEAPRAKQAARAARAARWHGPDGGGGSKRRLVAAPPAPLHFFTAPELELRAL